MKFEAIDAAAVVMLLGVLYHRRQVRLQRVGKEVEMWREHMREKSLMPFV